MAQPRVQHRESMMAAALAGRDGVSAPQAVPAADTARRRVLVVAPQPFYEDRGTCIAVRQVVQSLGVLGYATDLLTYPVGQPIDIPGVRIVRAANPLRLRHVPIGFSWRKLVLDVTLVASFVRLLREQRYSLVHAVEEAAFPAVMLGRRHGVPVLYDMQSSLPEQLKDHPFFRQPLIHRWLRRCEEWLLERADVVVGSLGLAARVRRAAPRAHVEEWRFPSQHVAASADAVLDLRQALGLPTKARVVLYSGTFEPYQGLGELLKAFAEVRFAVPDAVLVLVGGVGASCDALEQQAKALGIEDTVRVVGRQPREAVPRYIGMADVLVSTRAYGANLPLKIFDYLAAGKPIVASNPGCHGAVLTTDRALVVAHTPRDLARALILVLRDDGLAKRLSAGARRFAAATLEQSGFVQTLASLYDRAIAGAAAPRDS